jgi:hypothetical protein
MRARNHRIIMPPGVEFTNGKRPGVRLKKP